MTPTVPTSTTVAKPPAATVPLFKVTSQYRLPNGDDISGEQDVWRIDFQTAAGTSSYIIVPQELYTAENVAKLVTEAANKLHTVDRLQGEQIVA